MKSQLLMALIAVLPNTIALASDSTGSDGLQDMSDPMAVYTQVGSGITNKGLNLKLGSAYDTMDPETIAMHVLELKGALGDSLSLEGNDSINEGRYRHFKVNTSNGMGSQIDFNWNFEQQSGLASYSFLQALPAFGPLELYPLAGAGIVLQDNEGYEIPASYATVGLYSKLAISDDVWMNYNPTYSSQLGGDNQLKSMFGFLHEATVSYQIDSKQNVRFFVNWGKSLDSTNVRLEYNYQL
ncbi:hypothetical protein [Vibrio alfacsensis]|uniref:hypothetical protein n=1 Tax=Vibrio alfacsensis TaxID=1074311 RepID=UPI001BF03BC5|nr:hypothetical protein [Vibrio alfacsensis]BCN26190.1 hypothetical protein VYA_33820 [Vibrio alfacsensis]